MSCHCKARPGECGDVPSFLLLVTMPLYFFGQPTMAYLTSRRHPSHQPRPRWLCNLQPNASISCAISLAWVASDEHRHGCPHLTNRHQVPTGVWPSGSRRQLVSVRCLTTFRKAAFDFTMACMDERRRGCSSGGDEAPSARAP